MFTTGQKVVCINDEFAPWVFDLYKQLPKKGKHYTVRSTGMGAANPNWSISDEGVFRGATEPDFNVLLQELQNPDDPTCSYKQELSFKSERFAPLEVDELEQEETAYAEELVPAGV
jgi:hypothetical protein